MSHYYVAHFLEGFEQGRVFNGNWSEHISLTPAFEAQDVAATSDVINMCIGEFDIRTQVAEKQIWGKEVKTEVLTLTDGESIRDLHTTLCEKLVRMVGAKLLDTTWLDENFTPHISLQPSNPDFAFKGSITFDELTLLEFVGDDKNDIWRIVDVIRKEK